MIVDGELYIHSNNNDFNTICSLVKKTKPTEEDLAESARLIEYWVYDVPSHNGPFDRRKVSLYKFHGIDKVKMVSSSEAPRSPAINILSSWRTTAIQVI